MARSITIHCFFSVKGGVGKSTLAVALAHLLPEPRRAVVIDFDLTGTSLATGLDLEAPEVALDEKGRMDLLAKPTGQFLSVEKSRILREKRKENKEENAALPPSYTNDALAFEDPKGGDEDCKLESLLWRHQNDKGIRYMPSSSIGGDIMSALQWIYRSDDDQEGWMRRTAWLLFAFSEQLDEVEHLILDMPPGMYGFTIEMLRLLHYIEDSKTSDSIQDYPPFHESTSWSIKPYLVTTEDRQDLFLAMETYSSLLELFPGLIPIVNRRTASMEQIKKRLKAHFDGLDVGHRLVAMDDYRHSLGRIFVEGDLDISDEERREIRAAFGIQDMS